MTTPTGTVRSITAEQRIEALREVNRRPSRVLGFFVEWAKVFTAAVLLFFFLNAFFVQAFKIPSGSMEGTLLVGDFLLVNKLAYGAEVPGTGVRLPRLREPQRGDVIVFEWPRDPSKNFVKRLVGVPGDTVAMRDGVLYRNGIPVREGYVRHEQDGEDAVYEEFRWQRDFLVRSASASGATGVTPLAYHPSRNNWGPLVVPEASYFVLGDNRDNSLDSRYWGFVPDSLVKGRPMVIYYSFAPDSVNGMAWLTRIRWQRLGELVH